MKKTMRHLLTTDNGRAVLWALSVSALMLVSCRKHHVEDDVDIPIGLSSSIASMNTTGNTRAGVIENLEQFETQGSFGVFGYKSASNALSIFNNAQVTWNSTAWQYNPIRFWDTSASHYYFGAYAPRVSSESGSGSGIYVSYVDNSVATFTIHHIPNWQLARYGTVTEANSPSHAPNEMSGKTP